MNNIFPAGAAAIWQMGELADSSGNGHDLSASANGGNRFELEGGERAESLRRGGDGVTCAFSRLGWLTAKKGNILRYGQNGMTVCIRLKADQPCGVFCANIFSLHLHDNGLLVAWLGIKQGEGDNLVDASRWAHVEGWRTLVITTRQFWGEREGDLGDMIVVLSSPDLENWTERGELFSVSKFPEPRDMHQA
jgi:hypothetical protein